MIKNGNKRQRFIETTDKIPIIIKKSCTCKLNIKELKETRYLINKNKTLSELAYVIRSKCNINKSDSIFLFSNNTIVCGTMLISELYNKYKDENNILHIFYSAENTFG